MNLFKAFFDRVNEASLRRYELPPPHHPPPFPPPAGRFILFENSHSLTVGASLRHKRFGSVSGDQGTAEMMLKSLGNRIVRNRVDECASTGSRGILPDKNSLLVTQFWGIKILRGKISSPSYCITHSTYFFTSGDMSHS